MAGDVTSAHDVVTAAHSNPHITKFYVAFIPMRMNESVLQRPVLDEGLLYAEQEMKTQSCLLREMAWQRAYHGLGGK